MIDDSTGGSILYYDSMELNRMEKGPVQTGLASH
jgi:hypothetical protein